MIKKQRLIPLYGSEMFEVLLRKEPIPSDSKIPSFWKGWKGAWMIPGVCNNCLAYFCRPVLNCITEIQYACFQHAGKTTTEQIWSESKYKYSIQIGEVKFEILYSPRRFRIKTNGKLKSIEYAPLSIQNITVDGLEITLDCMASRVTNSYIVCRVPAVGINTYFPVHEVILLIVLMNLCPSLSNEP